MQKLSAVHGAERSERYVGRVVPVLVEGRNPKNTAEEVYGRTRQGRHVFFRGGDELLGTTLPVKITGARTWSLFGEIAV